MVRENTSLSFEEYFWKDLDIGEKLVLDAGTGFGLTTCEIAKRIYQQKRRSKIVSVDIDPGTFEQARKLLQSQKLLDRVDFVKADLSSMPEIASESVNIVISTRTLADINSILCRLARAITEFYRVLKLDGQIVLSDECPCITSSSEEEEVAVKRWQLVKAVSHLTGRPHANEIKPEDLEFIMHLAGFQKCRWAIFKGDKISQPRIDHFVTKATEQTRKIRNARLKKALRQEIMSVREMFDKQGGIFPPRYILHAQK